MRSETSRYEEFTEDVATWSGQSYACDNIRLEHERLCCLVLIGAVTRYYTLTDFLRKDIAMVVERAGMAPQTIPRIAPATLARSTRTARLLRSWRMQQE